jgi:hypothetical protein
VNWLNRYLKPDVGNAIYSQVWQGNGQSVVTCGSHLLAVDDPAATFDALRVTGVGNIDHGSAISQLLTRPTPDTAMVTTLGDLWAWLDRVERHLCPGCVKGHYPIHYTEGGMIYPFGPYEIIDWRREIICETCDGNLWVFPYVESGPKPDVVCFGRCVFDRNALAWWLPAELGDAQQLVRIWVTPTGRSHILIVQGSVWKLLTVEMQAEKYRGRYRTYYPGAGLWWTHRRDPVAMLTAQDWCQEKGYDYWQMMGLKKPRKKREVV